MKSRQRNGGEGDEHHDHDDELDQGGSAAGKQRSHPERMTVFPRAAAPDRRRPARTAARLDSRVRAAYLYRFTGTTSCENEYWGLRL
jgi:hypothetical protein